MKTYHRQTVQIREDQRLWLRNLSFKTGKSNSHIIREILDIAIKLSAETEKVALDKTP
jgi:predicted DNA-binding protein